MNTSRLKFRLRYHTAPWGKYLPSWVDLNVQAANVGLTGKLAEAQKVLEASPCLMLCGRTSDVRKPWFDTLSLTTLL